MDVIMKKRLFTAALIVLVAALTLGCFTACCGDADYFADLAEYGFWANDPEEAIAQPKIGQLVRDFLNSPLPDGKTAKKVAFIGYDGCRADTLINVLDTPDEIGGDNSTSLYSGIAEVLKGEDSGIYYAYAGGQKGKDNYKYIKGFRDEDAMAYELLHAIYSRPSFQREDWLIAITTDHGGIETWHGGQTLEERSTWIVCNKPIDEKYMGSGYDGYTEK